MAAATTQSRWGPEHIDEVQIKIATGVLPNRKSKWGPDLSQDPVAKRGRALALQTRAEQIAAMLAQPMLEMDMNERTRSPSPEPIYGDRGQRINTREARHRERLDTERRDAISEVMRLNPSFKPPVGFKPVMKEAKLYIPQKLYPHYNFIGLILGPRGNTQKRMEGETGCKIAIRGKGAVKEGRLATPKTAKHLEGADDELHVHIAGDTIEKVEAAVNMIEPLLHPVDEEANIHKRKQLRELAEMNGTIRDFVGIICTTCGETGHKSWMCPKEQLQTFQAKVSCAICGDGGHPTIDCPRRNTAQGQMLDKEYMSFMAELGEGVGGVPLAGPTPVIPGYPASAVASTTAPPTTTAAGASTFRPGFIPGQNGFRPGLGYTPAAPSSTGGPKPQQVFTVNPAQGRPPDWAMEIARNAMRASALRNGQPLPADPPAISGSSTYSQPWATPSATASVPLMSHSSATTASAPWPQPQMPPLPPGVQPPGLAPPGVAPPGVPAPWASTGASVDTTIAQAQHQMWTPAPVAQPWEVQQQQQPPWAQQAYQDLNAAAWAQQHATQMAPPQPVAAWAPHDYAQSLADPNAAVQYPQYSHYAQPVTAPVYSSSAPTPAAPAPAAAASAPSIDSQYEQFMASI
eukprot:jgi/Chlat1/3614/Chrsp237S03624